MDDPQPEQIVIELDKSWYLYVGEIKAAGLNRLLNGTLAGRYGKPARCIHIIPDVLSHYPPGHFLVVNPGTGSPDGGLDHPRNVRIPPSVFAAHVSSDVRVIELVRKIREVQGEVQLSRELRLLFSWQGAEVYGICIILLFLHVTSCANTF